MEMQEIEFTIDREGRVHLQVKGVKGSSCVDLTEPIEEALGGEVESRDFTSEYYEQSQVDTGRHLRREQGDSP